MLRDKNTDTLRISTAHDFRVISARKWARARTQRMKFPSS